MRLKALMTCMVDMLRRMTEIAGHCRQPMRLTLLFPTPSTTAILSFLHRTLRLSGLLLERDPEICVRPSTPSSFLDLCSMIPVLKRDNELRTGRGEIMKALTSFNPRFRHSSRSQADIVYDVVALVPQYLVLLCCHGYFTGEKESDRLSYDHTFVLRKPNLHAETTG